MTSLAYIAFFSTDGDFDEVWEEHCKNADLLEEYAEAMHHLAIDHWDKNPDTTSRIDWCRRNCLQYFYEGGLEKALEKELKRKLFAEKENLESGGDFSQSDQRDMSGNETLEIQTVPLMTTNVGSSKNRSKHIEVEVIPLTNYNSDESKNDTKENVKMKEPELLTNNEIKDVSSGLNELNLTANNNEDDMKVDINTARIHHEIDELERLGEDDASSKCQEFLDRGDFVSLAEIGEEGVDVEQNDCTDAADDTIDKQAIYSKYGPAKYNTM